MALASQDVRDALRRHQAFWEWAEAEKPLVSTVRWPHHAIHDFDWGLLNPEGILHPEMLVVDHFMPQYESYYEAGGVLDGDLFWPAVPPRAVPWLEGIVGCSIRYSTTYGSIVTEPAISDWSWCPQLEPLSDNLWFKKLVEFTKGLVRLAAGRFPVAVSHTRGPWDLVSALRGMENVYLDVYDHPTELRRLAEMCADVWIEVTKHLAEIIPAWQGGYVGIFGLWAPKFTPTPQNDSSVSVSAKMYRELMLPADSRTVHAWQSPVFHLHSAGSHLVECVLDILEGRALNVVIDPAGPSLDELLSILRRVQAWRIPLHLISTDWEQIEELTATLSSCGLAVSYVPLSQPREFT